MAFSGIMVGAVRSSPRTDAVYKRCMLKAVSLIALRIYLIMTGSMMVVRTSDNSPVQHAALVTFCGFMVCGCARVRGRKLWRKQRQESEYFRFAAVWRKDAAKRPTVVGQEKLQLR